VSTLPFAHLHCHSHYSLLDGAGTVKGLLERAKALANDGLGAYRSWKSARAVKFIRRPRNWASIRSSAWRHTSPGQPVHKEASRLERGELPSDAAGPRRVGFRNLVQLRRRPSWKGSILKPRIDKELLAAHREGADLLERLRLQRVEPTLLAGGETNFEKALEIAAWYRELFGDDYYIEIQNNHLEVQTGGDGRVDRGGQSAGIPLCPPATSTTSTRRLRGTGHSAVREHGQVPHRYESYADGDE